MPGSTERPAQCQRIEQGERSAAGQRACIELVRSEAQPRVDGRQPDRRACRLSIQS